MGRSANGIGRSRPAPSTVTASQESCRALRASANSRQPVSGHASSPTSPAITKAARYAQTKRRAQRATGSARTRVVSILRQATAPGPPPRPSHLQLSSPSRLSIRRRRQNVVSISPRGKSRRSSPPTFENSSQPSSTSIATRPNPWRPWNSPAWWMMCCPARPAPWDIWFRAVSTHAAEDDRLVAGGGEGGDEGDDVEVAAGEDDAGAAGADGAAAQGGQGQGGGRLDELLGARPRHGESVAKLVLG